MTSTSNISQKANIFKQVRGIPFPEVQAAFLGEEPKRGKLPCPFHLDRTPSFHIYDDGFKCFGCGENGDAVDFVAKLQGISPLSAAKAIAGQFGIKARQTPLTRKERLKMAQEKAQRDREKRLQQAFSRWCKQAGERARILAEAVRFVMAEKGVDIDDDLVELIHLLPIFEHWADVLALGTDAERIEIYQNNDARWWLSGHR